MYIVILSIVSLKPAATLALSRGVSWSRPWAPSRPLPSPWSPKRQSRGHSEPYITFPTHMSLPQMPPRSTHTLIATISPAHGAPFPLLPSSLPASRQDPKLPFGMWWRPTEPSLLCHPNGQGLSFTSRQKTSSQSIHATTSASRQPGGHRVCWQMPGQTFFGERGWAPSQNGSMTTSFFESPVRTYSATMRNVPCGTRRFKRSEARDRRVAGSGMQAKRYQAAPWRSSMRTAVPRFATLLTPPHALQKIRISRTPMQTLMSSQNASVSSGRRPKQSPLAWRSPIWASAGTCKHGGCISPRRKKPNTCSHC